MATERQYAVEGIQLDEQLAATEFAVEGVQIGESVVGATTDTGAPVIRVKSNVQPSYQNGYAKNASESAYPNLWDGLVGAWVPALGPKGGTVVKDVSGRGLDGTMTGNMNGSHWQQTEKGAILQFGGVIGSVDTGTDHVLPLGSSARTMVVCCRIDSFPTDNTDGICGYGTNSNGKEFGIYAEDNAISVEVWGHRVITPKSTLATGTFYSVAAIVPPNSTTSSDIQIWIDAENQSLSDEVGSSKTLNTATSQVRIGRAAVYTARYFEGQVLGLCIYERALSQFELRQLYADPLAPFRRRITIPYSYEAAATVTTDTGAPVIRVKSNVQPSYQNGYAKNASESACPELWDGFQHAWSVALDPRAGNFADLVGQSGMEMNGSTVDRVWHDVGAFTVTSLSGGAVTLNESQGTVSFRLGTSNWTGVGGGMRWQVGSSLFDLANGSGTRYSGWSKSGNDHRFAWTTTGLTNNNYHTFTVRWLNGGDTDFYVDGNYKGQTTALDATFDTTNDSTITLAGSNCRVNSVSIWDRRLTDWEIKQIGADHLAPFRRRITIPYSYESAAPAGAFNIYRNYYHQLLAGNAGVG